jgi:hypothetical protein
MTHKVSGEYYAILFAEATHSPTPERIKHMGCGYRGYALVPGHCPGCGKFLRYLEIGSVSLNNS